jgi:anti-sigma factor RsiW
MNHITENHDALVDYLYEEGDPAERLKVAKHLQECAECAVAVLEFQNVRGMLGNWTPPLASPSATMTSPSASVDHRAGGGWSWGWGSTASREKSRLWNLRKEPSRWGVQAAAAVLLFLSGMAVSQLRVDYTDGTVTVSRQSAAPTMAALRNPSSITLPPDNVNPTSADAVIDRLEQELRRRLQVPPQNAASTEDLLQRVRSMIDQSERRQQHELAVRLSQVTREVDTQHQADLLRIQQDFGKQQEAALEYLVRTGGVK